MNIIDYTIQEYNVHLYRYENLVYVATFKCASTYYTTLLQSNGWNRIVWEEINWDKDHVFGFLIDPVVRYVKALAEDYINEESTELEQLILNFLEKSLPRSTLITFHSIPISVCLKEYTKKIDWIPIDRNFNHHSLFLKLLDKHNVTLYHYGDMVDSHIGTEYKKDLEKKILTFFNYRNKHISFKLLFCEDLELFDQVKNKIDPKGIHWDSISWLRRNDE